MKLAEWVKTAPPLGIYLEKGYGALEWYATIYRIGATPRLTPANIDGPPPARREALDEGRAQKACITLFYRSAYTPNLRDLLNHLRMDALEDRPRLTELEHRRFRMMIGARYWNELIYSVDL